jgi:GMP synthase (glutamine-hydrolysing)
VRVLCVVHQPDAGPGVFLEPLERRGHELVEWVPAESHVPPEGFGAAIVLGGGMHPDQEDSHPWLRREKAFIEGLLRAEVPTLGVCLGAELVAEAAGAPPRRLPRPEVCWSEVQLTADGARDPVLGGLPSRFTTFEWHSFETPLPSGAAALARRGERVEAFRLGRAWGIQFHAEVTREIVTGWIERYRDDADLRDAGIDPRPLVGETDAHIAASNALGRELCGGFLDAAAAPTGDRVFTPVDVASVGDTWAPPPAEGD